MVVLVATINILLASDKLDTFYLEEVKVETNRILPLSEHTKKSTINSTDDFLRQTNQVNLISRSVYAREPIVRGLSGARTQVRFNGTPVFGACVDNMDPASSYIELLNTESLELGGSTYGVLPDAAAHLNFKSQRPEFGNKYKSNVFTNYSSVNSQINTGVNAGYSNNNFYSNISFIFKDANDFRTGNGNQIDNSGFTKQNLATQLAYKINSKNLIAFDFIGDWSQNVGFPALIMDTRRTDANMFSLSYKYNKQNLFIDQKIFYNDIYHLMDDNDRSDEEIQNRSVMPNMRMPMVGTTQTVGYNANLKKITSNSIFGFYLEYYNLNMFGDMLMIPLDESQSEMYLYNIADANINNFSFSFNLSNYFKSFETNFAAGIGLRNSNLLNTDGRNALLASIDADSDLVSHFLINTSAEIRYSVNKNSKLILGAKYRERGPNRIEMYSFYIYNPVDDAIYLGNPDLEKERSIEIDLAYLYNAESFSINFNIFSNSIQNYIAGLITSPADLQNPIFPQAIRTYQNTGLANIYGAELNLRYSYKDFHIDYSGKYNRAWSEGLQDNLPFISPFESNLFFVYSLKKLEIIFNLVHNFEQSHISSNFFNEDTTPEFFVINLKSKWQVSGRFNLEFGIDNIFNNFYNYHASVNNLPAFGRNFYFSFNYKIFND